MNSPEDFRRINILYYTLLAGQILFCAVLLFSILDAESRQSGWPEAPFGLVVPILLAGVIPVALYVNKTRLAAGSEQADLAAKIEHYKGVVIIRSGLLEGVNLFALIALLLENNSTYLIFFAAGLLLFLYFRPSVSEFLQHYQLSSAEKAAFN